MFFKKYGDIVVSLFYMLLSAGMMIMASMLPKSKVMEIGPDFMPMVIGIITFILAAILLISSIRNFKANAAEVAAGAPDDSDYKRVISSFILVLAYVFLMRPVGFLVTTVVYLFLQMLVLAPNDKRSKKDILLLLVIGVVFTLLVFFLFRYGFKIVLPAGIFTINL